MVGERWCGGVRIIEGFRLLHRVSFGSKYVWMCHFMVPREMLGKLEN